MRLAIVSHKPCFGSADSPSGYETDGGFPVQMRAISELFSETALVVPCRENIKATKGMTFLDGKKLTVVPLSASKGEKLRRKLLFPLWLIINGKTIWREIKKADAVHAPIPGDVGTIGLYFALLLGKPLFVRHCGNWLVQRTKAERFWKWTMEHFAGGRNVMFATGGTENAPSSKNHNIKWIFSTSLTQEFVENAEVPPYPENGKVRLITACRLENRKGVEHVIDSMMKVLEVYPDAELDIVGGGSLEDSLRARVLESGLDHCITFHGKVEQARVIELMGQAHVFCFPTSASEGFPKVVIEALASGLPVVTTNVSVLPKLIGAKCGILLDKPGGASVAKAVVQIFDDRELFLRLSGNAVETAKKHTLENWRDFIGQNLKDAWKVQSLSSD